MRQKCMRSLQPVEESRFGYPILHIVEGRRDADHSTVATPLSRQVGCAQLASLLCHAGTAESYKRGGRADSEDGRAQQKPPIPQSVDRRPRP